MERGPGSEEPAAGFRCSSCGTVTSQPARYCPSCGRRLAGEAPDMDIAGWVEAGWRLFLRNIGLAIGIPLIVIVPMIAFFVFGYFGFIGVAVLSDGAPRALRVAGIALGALLGLGALVLALAMPALQAGIYACFVDATRTGKLTTGNLWAGFRHWWACTWVTGLLGFAMVMTLPLALVVIGIPLHLGLFSLMWLSLFRIVDERRGGMEALSFAWRVMHGRLWMMVLFTFLIYILMSAGVMGMYFGVVVTVPIGMGALAAGYDSLSKKERLPARA